jgi:hypothetical protein
MGRDFAFVPLFIFGILLCACTSSTLTPSPIPVLDTPFPTHTPTFAIPTIAPSETPIPSPVPSETPDPLEGLGEVIFLDDFSENLGWDLREDELGGTSINQGRMTISLHQSKSLRYVLAPVQPLDDFYIEVEVRPEICQPDDEFGLLFRVNSQIEYYRFSFNCAGETRVSRTLQDGSRSLTSLEVTPSVHPGPKASNKLAIRASGDHFQIWINEFEALTFRDASIQIGIVGLFVRTGRSNLATVTFDNLQIRDTL